MVCIQAIVIQWRNKTLSHIKVPYPMDIIRLAVHIFEAK